jgi:hypothetical protein
MFMEEYYSSEFDGSVPKWIISDKGISDGLKIFFIHAIIFRNIVSS